MPRSIPLALFALFCLYLTLNTVVSTGAVSAQSENNDLFPELPDIPSCSYTPGVRPSCSPNNIAELPNGMNGGNEQIPPSAETLSPAVKTFIGVLIVLLASAMDAIGLNLQRSDHLRNAALPETSQRHELKRPVFLFGMFLYLASQVNYKLDFFFSL